MVFLIIGGIGLVILILAFILGDIADFSGHLEGFGGDAFSLASIAGFVSAFGFGAAVGNSLFRSLAVAIPMGIIVGLAVGAILIRVTKYLHSSSAEGGGRTDALVGREGVVISAIPANGFGEIRVRDVGNAMKISARSEEAIEQGANVWISGVLSPTSVAVTRTQALETGSATGEVTTQ